METVVVVIIGLVAVIGWVWFCWNHPFLAMFLNLFNIFSE